MGEVAVTFEGKKGKILWEEDDYSTFTVEMPDGKEDKAIEIVAYMQTERAFMIPRSNRIDDYDVVRAKPVKEQRFWELALCELEAETGVTVLW